MQSVSARVRRLEKFRVEEREQVHVHIHTCAGWRSSSTWATTASSAPSSSRPAPAPSGGGVVAAPSPSGPAPQPHPVCARARGTRTAAHTLPRARMPARSRGLAPPQPIRPHRKPGAALHRRMAARAAMDASGVKPRLTASPRHARSLMRPVGRQGRCVHARPGPYAAMVRRPRPLP
jgi:hypothetical protein